MYSFSDSNSIENFIKENVDLYRPVVNALKNGNLIIFVGSGMSMHLGLPSWRDFALELLDFVYLHKKSTLLNFRTKESLKKEDTKKLLSICKHLMEQSIQPSLIRSKYEDMFITDIQKVNEKGLYELLYQLNAIYLTTNYDNAFDLFAEPPLPQDKASNILAHETESFTENFSQKVYSEIDSFKKEILQLGNVIHIHGSVRKCDDLLISYEDYIERYSNDPHSGIYNNPKYMNFINSVINGDYVVLFVGYGLEEFEILQFLFEKRKEPVNKRYLLLGCYPDEYLKINHYSEYYSKNYNISIIPYNIAERGHDEIGEFFKELNKLKSEEYVEKRTTFTEFKKGMSMIEEMYNE